MMVKAEVAVVREAATAAAAVALMVAALIVVVLMAAAGSVSYASMGHRGSLRTTGLNRQAYRHNRRVQSYAR
jgi:hypothetical protein